MKKDYDWKKTFSINLDAVYMAETLALKTKKACKIFGLSVAGTTQDRLDRLVYYLREGPL